MLSFNGCNLFTQYTHYKQFKQKKYERLLSSRHYKNRDNKMS